MSSRPMVRSDFEAAYGTGIATVRPDLGDLAAFGATHYAGLVMGA